MHLLIHISHATSKGGLCNRHRPDPRSKKKKRTCSVEGCDKWRYGKGGVSYFFFLLRITSLLEHQLTSLMSSILYWQLCVGHGGKRNKQKPCCMEGCTKLSVKAGYCWKHAPKETCTHPGCDNQSNNSDGTCHKHKKCRVVKYCTQEGCANKAVAGDPPLCNRHREGREDYAKWVPLPCIVDGCTTPRRIKGGWCRKHAPKKDSDLCNMPECDNPLDEGEDLCVECNYHHRMNLSET